jgi:hypothetical protein
MTQTRPAPTVPAEQVAEALGLLRDLLDPFVNSDAPESELRPDREIARRTISAYATLVGALRPLGDDPVDERMLNWLVRTLRADLDAATRRSGTGRSQHDAR